MTLQKHQVTIRGKQYFTVAGRVLAFREAHPDWRVITDLLSFDDSHCIASAKIVTADGAVLATGHGAARSAESSQYSGRYIEKAETAAVGRALGFLGFGELIDEDEADYDAMRKRFHATGKELYGDDWDNQRAVLVASITGGKQTSSKDLTIQQLDRLLAGMMHKLQERDAETAKQGLTGDDNGERRL